MQLSCIDHVLKSTKNFSVKNERRNVRDFHVHFLFQVVIENYSIHCTGSKYTLLCGALRDLISFVQFKKREKHPLLKVTLLHACFLHFLNRTNGTKSRRASHMQ